jgi:hypothetical protein
VKSLVWSGKKFATVTHAMFQKLLFNTNETVINASKSKLFPPKNDNDYLKQFILFFYNIKACVLLPHFNFQAVESNTQ